MGTNRTNRSKFDDKFGTYLRGGGLMRCSDYRHDILDTDYIEVKKNDKDLNLLDK